MGSYLFYFLIILFAVAVILNEDFIFVLIYLLAGSFLLGRGWSYRALKSIAAERTFTSRAFFGEKIRVDLEIINTGWLPMAWMQLHESLPVQLAYPSSIRQVVTMGSKAKTKIEYMLEGRKRGYYEVGPLQIYSGDVLGVVDGIERVFGSDYLTVYPKIIPLTNVLVPSSSPLGNLRHKQPIFEDPTRIIGKRDYHAGDSLRRIDWKTTATTGKLKVKNFEPSIALETALFLNLNATEYNPKLRFDNSELAIVVAASLANWVVSQRQAVGLVTNGSDPLAEAGGAPRLVPRRGRGYLMRILDVLARIECIETYPMADLIRRERYHLSWGTTLLVITPVVDEALFDELLQARRAGMNVFLALVGIVPGFQDIQRKARMFGFPVYSFHQERDLDVWRQ